MILPVLQIPDPFLKAHAHLVDPHTEGLQTCIDNMLETLYHHKRCVGIAATQIGKPWRLIVVDASRVDKEGSRHGCIVMLNPWIVERRYPKRQREGCLSVPDYTGNVVRSTMVEIQGKDRGGNPINIKAVGFEAVVFQHELDHLEGKLFIDRVASLETDVFHRKNY